MLNNYIILSLADYQFVSGSRFALILKKWNKYFIARLILTCPGTPSFTLAMIVIKVYHSSSILKHEWHITTICNLLILFIPSKRISLFQNFYHFHLNKKISICYIISINSCEPDSSSMLLLRDLVTLEPDLEVGVLGISKMPINIVQQGITFWLPVCGFTHKYYELSLS